MADHRQDSSGNKPIKGAGDVRQKVVHLVQKSAIQTAEIPNLPVDQIEALLEVGTKESNSQNYAASREAFFAAAELARSLHRSDLLVKAALGMGKTFAGLGPGIVDHQLASLTEESLAAIGSGDSRERALLLARLGVDVYWSRDRERALQLGREAVEIARRIGDIATLVAVSNLRQWMLWGPANLEQRLAIATEMVSLARQVKDWDALFRAHRERVWSLLEMGEIHEVDIEIAAIENLAQSVGSYSGDLERFRVMRALMRGELDDAEQWLERLLAIAQQHNDRVLLFSYTGQLGVLLGERGRGAELSPLLTGTSSEMPQLPVVRMAMAVLYARTNRLSQARVEFEYLAVDGFGVIPDDWNWLGTTALLAEVCVKIGDLDRAPILHRLLSPYAGRSATLGYGDVYYNCVSHYLALLSAALGESDRARRQFESALRFNRRMGAGVALAYTQVEYARLLLQCQGSDERRQAVELLQTARDTAESIGLMGLLAEVEKAGEEATAPATVGLTPTSDRKETATFRREGDVWTLSWGRDTFRLRRLKGLEVIHILLGCPNQAVHVSELARIMDGNGAIADSRAAAFSGDAGPLLDPEAKKEYRTRLNDLRDELDEARSFNDVGRIDRVSTEIEFLEREISRAVGLGGRDRRAGSVSERTRVRVTNAIRLAIEQIGKSHRGLSDHLRVAVRTGTLCTYRPDPASAPKWDL
jgi:tetratricopeptide (TPR) repeat protein